MLSLLGGPLALAALAALVLLPLLLAAVVVRGQLLSDSADAAHSDLPWWQRRTSMDERGAAAGRQDGGGKLAGGARLSGAPALVTCKACGAADPPHRCAQCSSVAYCSRECQQRDWKQGHKALCKKLKKQRKADARAAAAAAHADAGSGSDDEAGGAAGMSWASGAAPSAAAAQRPEESNSTPPLPRQILYPSERYEDLAAAPPQRKAPSGLSNCGNTCYANSLLQSLLATPALAAYLVSGEHSRGCRKPSPSEWCVLCELEALATAAYPSGGGSPPKTLNPRPLLRHVKRLGRHLTFGRQEDSHELFVRLVEAVEAVQLLEAGGTSRYDPRSRETTLIHHVFGGYTRTTVECLACGHASRTYESCTGLTLEVSARITSLEAALRAFSATERLDGDNKYMCDGCKSRVAADKFSSIEAAPHHLNICLKRFAPGRYSKITSRLSYPESLDLAPFMARGARVDCGPALYELYAVVVHLDWNRSTDYGHSRAYVPSGGAWDLCDDASVSPVAASKALGASAYLLFYQRQQPRPVVPAHEAAAAAAAGQEAAAVAGGEAEGAAGAAPAMAALRMLRVETAPAGLPHLGAEEGAAAAAQLGDSSRASSRSDLDAQQQEEQAEGEADIAAGTPNRLHASASAGDIAAAALSPRRAAAAASTSPLAQQQQAAAAAAEEARAEVEALRQEGQPASPRSDSGSSSSGGGGGELAASANPFNLLGEDGGAGSEAGGSSGGEEEEEDGQAGAAAVQRSQQPAEPPERQPPQQPDEQRREEQQQGGRACTPAHRASVVPSGAGGRRVLRLSVDLPGVQEQSQVDWRLAGGGGASAQKLLLSAQGWELALPLPVAVADGEGVARWRADSQQLTVTWPLL